MIDIKTIACASIGTNMYLLTDVATQKKALVDCPPVRGRQIAFLEENGVETLDYIFLTHGHFDHILGLGDVQSRFGGKIVIHEKDADCLHDHEKALCRWSPLKPLKYKADILVHEGDMIQLGESTFTVLHTPGHTEGSVCYRCDDVLFTGDTLFFETCGRVDFPGGDPAQMMESLQRLASLDENYRVLPGHNEETTLEHEKRYNPYIRH